MDLLPSTLNIVATRTVRFVRKTIRNISDIDKSYYFFIFEISDNDGVVRRFTEARLDPIDDALLHKYGFNTDRPKAKDNSIANWVLSTYFASYIDGEVLTLIQFEIEDVNCDGTPEYKTFITRQ
jgi:hypothetical protein